MMTKDGMFVELTVPKGNTFETMPIFIFPVEWRSDDEFQRAQMLQVCLFL